MKFYILQVVEDDSQEGPSIIGFRDGYDINSENSATLIQRYKKVDFNPDLDFVLADYGKATDLLDIGNIYSNRLFVSPRFHEILMASNLLDHQSFKAIVRDGSRILNYHYIHFFFKFDSDDNHLVNFAKTKFVATKITNEISILALPAYEEGVLGEFKVSSWEEFHALREKRENDSWHKVIIPSGELHIKQKWLLDLDLFYLEFNNYTLNNFVVSEKLAETISNSKLTGVKLSTLPYELTLL